MRRAAEQIHTEIVHIHGDTAQGLGSVGVQHRPTAVTQFGDLGNRLEDANFVLGRHHGDERGVVIDRSGERLDINTPRLSVPLRNDRQTRDAKPDRFELGDGIEHRRMLGANGDHVTPTLTRMGAKSDQR